MGSASFPLPKKQRASEMSVMVVLLAFTLGLFGGVASSAAQDGSDGGKSFQQQIPMPGFNFPSFNPPPQQQPPQSPPSWQPPQQPFQQPQQTQQQHYPQAPASPYGYNPYGSPYGGGMGMGGNPMQMLFMMQMLRGEMESQMMLPMMMMMNQRPMMGGGMSLPMMYLMMNGFNPQEESGESS